MSSLVRMTEMPSVTVGKSRTSEPPYETKDAQSSKSGNAFRTSPDVSATMEAEGASAGPEEPDREPEARKLQCWNQSPLSMFRYFVTLFCFFVFGMNDAAIGPLIPYIEPYYGVNHMVASLLFLSPFVGYVAAALMTNMIHHHVGQRGVAIIGPICRIASYIPMALHAPFPTLVVMMLFTGFAGGLQDSSWNAWIGNLQNANELLGFLHGCYGAGATISPLLASALVADRGLPWNTYYYIMLGVAALDLVLETTAFWSATGAVFRAEQELHRQLGNQVAGDDEAPEKQSPLGKALRSPITWLLSFFLLAYVGIEVSLGGWLVTFMLDVRSAEPFAAGLSATGFWLGITVGRITMGFVVGRLGEKAAITVCLSLCIALQLIYWLVPNFIASAVAISFMGFFLGPLFGTAIVVAAKLLPTEYHVPVIGFVSAFGGGGAAVLPFVVGILAEQKGVQTLQYLALVVFIFIISLWVCLPGGMKRGGLERARANNEKVGHQIRSLISFIRGRSKRSD